MPASMNSSATPRYLRDLETVYVNMIAAAYNFGMRKLFRPALLVCLLAADLCGQTPTAESLSIVTQELPRASLWNPYRVSFEASGGVEPYRWEVIGGRLPRGFQLETFGELTGGVEDTDSAEFTVRVTDKTKKEAQKRFVLRIMPPLTVEWDHQAEVNGQAINGAVKVSNHTGRNFDLTFVVLAVNDIGRATAIGYQHFPLKKNTSNFQLSFGGTPSRGNYVVNIDVVGEEPGSNRIFRARLVTGKETVSEGP
jgi:hypothetical protein